MASCIKVSHIVKRYGAIMAVDDVSFDVKQNEIFAFLGPNGAGKSTMIAILSTLSDFDSGNICVEGFHRGKEDANIRSLLGVVFQGSMLDDTLSVSQNLMLRCGLYGMFHIVAKQRVQEIAKLCSLHHILPQKVNQLSGGQRRRVDIARALIPSPKLLILDEPSTGLDPKSRQNLWKTILDLKEKSNMTVFMTTHYMEEAEIADHICMINKGKIIVDARKEQLLQKYQKNRLLLYTGALQQVATVLHQKRFRITMKDTYVSVEIDSFYQLMAILRSTEMFVHHVEMEKGSIEELYLSLVREDAG